MTNMTDLPTADALQLPGVSEVMLATVTKIIVVAGEAESGKTTLITGIYRQFRSGPFAGFDFSYSKTLQGLESRLHEALTKSGRSEPGTARTLPSHTDRFMHLRVRRYDEMGPKTDLLMTDWPGETFRLARDSLDDMKRLPLLDRCDHLAVLVDGKMMSRPDQRHVVAADADMFLQRATDAGMIGSKSSVDVIFTKWDIVAQDRPESGTQAFAQSIETRLEGKYADRLGKLRFWRIADRSVPGSGPQDLSELISLFQSWVEDRAPAQAAGASGDSLVANREFDRYSDADSLGTS